MVKCADCGFLAQHIYRGNIPMGFIDVEEAPRETGLFPSRGFSFRFIPLGQPDMEPEKMDGDKFPTCFSRVFQLGQEVKACHSEMQEAEKDASFTNAVKEVMHKDRICKQFVKWERGFTPKEHREMLDRDRLLKWQAEREEADRKWHSYEEHRNIITNAVLAGIFTFIGAGIGALITWLLSR